MWLPSHWYFKHNLTWSSHRKINAFILSCNFRRTNYAHLTSCNHFFLLGFQCKILLKTSAISLQERFIGSLLSNLHTRLVNRAWVFLTLEEVKMNTSSNPQQNLLKVWQEEFQCSSFIASHRRGRIVGVKPILQRPLILSLLISSKFLPESKYREISHHPFYVCIIFTCIKYLLRGRSGRKPLRLKRSQKSINLLLPDPRKFNYFFFSLTLLSLEFRGWTSHLCL